MASERQKRLLELAPVLVSEMYGTVDPDNLHEVKQWLFSLPAGTDLDFDDLFDSYAEASSGTFSIGVAKPTSGEDKIFASLLDTLHPEATADQKASVGDYFDSLTDDDYAALIKAHTVDDGVVDSVAAAQQLAEGYQRKEQIFKDLVSELYGDDANTDSKHLVQNFVDEEVSATQLLATDFNRDEIVDKLFENYANRSSQELSPGTTPAASAGASPVASSDEDEVMRHAEEYASSSSDDEGHNLSGSSFDGGTHHGILAALTKGDKPLPHQQQATTTAVLTPSVLTHALAALGGKQPAPWSSVKAADTEEQDAASQQSFAASPRLVSAGGE